MLGVGNEGMSRLPGLNQIQFKGFCRFIDRSLIEKLLKFPKIEATDQESEFQLFVEIYQLVESSIKEKDDVYESLTSMRERGNIVFLVSKYPGKGIKDYIPLSFSSNWLWK